MKKTKKKYMNKFVVYLIFYIEIFYAEKLLYILIRLSKNKKLIRYANSEQIILMINK